jgi:hypothetical protein
MTERFSMSDPSSQSEADRAYASEMDSYFTTSLGMTMDKLRNFSKYVPRQTLALFLAKNEIFKRVVGVHGHIVECGVFLGGGLMTWAQLSAIYEPVNHVRRIVGFDTFEGFTAFHPDDGTAGLAYAREGGLSTGAEGDVMESIRLFDLNRPVGHIARVEIVPGDATSTIPSYLETNPHLVVALLYLDFDLYEPTKLAIETLLPRMPRGAVIAFDELNQKNWPGETKAVLESVGIRNLRIERFAFTPQISYAVLD